MVVFLDNKLAAMSDGPNDYIIENRAFGGNDSYTLNLSFPLKSSENIEIFGFIDREDVKVKKLNYDCEIRMNGIPHYGTLTITSVTPHEVTGQFLEGRAEINFSEVFEKSKISDLDLGKYPTVKPSEITPAQAWSNATDFVALPWVNNASGILQNGVTAPMGQNGYEWDDGTKATGLSWMPRLRYVAQKVCEALGYVCDFSVWDNSPWKWLICCNAIPAAWGCADLAEALPSWTVAEFFEQLEILLSGEFDFDIRAKKATFQFSAELAEKAGEINIPKASDELTREFSLQDSDLEYLADRVIAYASSDYDGWNLCACPWFIKSRGSSAKVYETLDELLDYLRNHPNLSGTLHDGSRPAGSGASRPAGRGDEDSDSDGQTRVFQSDQFFYAKDVDRYYILHTYNKSLLEEHESTPNLYVLNQELLSVNAFGPTGDEDSDEATLNIVPVRIDFTEEKLGRCAFLPFPATDSGNISARSETGLLTSEGRKKQQDEAIPQCRQYLQICAGEGNKSTSGYDKIYVGFWDNSHSFYPYLPYPIIENPLISLSFRRTDFPYTLSLKENIKKTLPQIKKNSKHIFEFFADEQPDIRAQFLIRGQRYLCEKLTTQFSGLGLSKLYTGIFHPITE